MLWISVDSWSDFKFQISTSTPCHLNNIISFQLLEQLILPLYNI